MQTFSVTDEGVGGERVTRISPLTAAWARSGCQAC